MKLDFLSGKRVFILAGVLALVIFIGDLSLPLGVAGGVPYVFPVLICTLSSRRSAIFAMAAVGTVLTILGYALSPDGGISWMVLTNRGLALFVVWVTAVMAFNYRRAEQALSVSEQRFRDIAEAGSDWIWEMDSDLRFTWQSKSKNGSPGPLDESVIGKVVEDLGAPEAQRDEWRQHLDDLRSHQPFRDFRVRRRSPDGSDRHLVISANPIFAGDGEFLGYRGLSRDVTAQVVAERKAVTLEKRFLDAIDHLSEQVALYDSDERLVSFNQGFMKSTGEAADFIEAGMTIEEILRTRFRYHQTPDEARGRVDDWIAERLRRFRDPSGPWQFHRGGQWFETRESKLPDGGTIVVVSNITELKQREQEVRDNEERYRTLVETSPYPIFVEREGSVVFANRAAVETFAAESAAQLVGLDGLALIHPDDRESVMARRRELSDGNIMNPTVERRCLRLDGSDFFAEARSAQYPWNGEPAWLVIINDITERKQIEEQLIQAQKMEAVGHLTGGMAHEFNNLLQAILGYLELLGDQVADDRDRAANEPAPARLVAGAIRACLRAADITRNLLAFARKQSLRPRSIDLDEVLSGMDDVVRGVLSETIDLRRVDSGDLWPAIADPAQVQSALINIVLNARDAMPEGGTLSIEVANARLDMAAAAALGEEAAAGDYVLLSVADTGKGIAPEVLDRVFEPFFTTKDVGEGTGLGLSMVYGFARQSNGFVNIRSTAGRGTRVELYLPRASVDEIGSDDRSDMRAAG